VVANESGLKISAFGSSVKNNLELLMELFGNKSRSRVTLILGFVMGMFASTAYAERSEPAERELTMEEKRKFLKESQELDENPRRAPRRQASQADIDNEVTEFQKFDTKMKAITVSSSNALTKSVPLSRVDADLERRYMQDGKYILTNFYYNDANYPRKYFGRARFTENDSEIFFTQTSTRIFTELLGGEYEKYEPELIVVHDELVGIKLLISNSTELEALISNPLIESSSHVGRAQYIDTTRR